MESIENLQIQAEEVAETLRMLAHPKRLLILCKLANGSCTVGELEKSCALSQSQLSQFLGKMKEEGMLDCEKKGLYVTYGIVDEKVKKLLDALASIYCNTNC